MIPGPRRGRGLLARGLSPSATRIVRLADWVMAILFCAYAGWCVASEWPAPGAWTWATVAAAALGVAWASFDWKARLDSRVRTAIVRNR